MPKQKYHYVYKITNLINNKIYIGKHTTSNLNDNYMGSSKYLKYAIKKYGKDNFSKEIIKMFPTEESAYEFEKIVVNTNFLERCDVYNKVIGGFGWGTLKASQCSIIAWKDEDCRNKMLKNLLESGKKSRFTSESMKSKLQDPILKEKYINNIRPYFTSSEHQSNAAKQIYIKHPEHKEFVKQNLLRYNKSEKGRNESRNRAEHMRNLLQQKSPDEKQLVKLKQSLGSLNKFPEKNIDKIKLKLLEIKELENKINENKK